MYFTLLNLRIASLVFKVMFNIEIGILLGDLEQLLLRSGDLQATNTDVTLTIGVAHITTGARE
jgi:hypothetical protein